MHFPIFQFYQSLIDGVPKNFGWDEYESRKVLPIASTKMKFDSVSGKFIELPNTKPDYTPAYLDENGYLIDFDGFINIWAKEISSELVGDVVKLLTETSKNDIGDVILNLIERVNFYTRNIKSVWIVREYPAFHTYLEEAKIEIIHACSYHAMKQELDMKKYSVNALSKIGVAIVSHQPKLQWMGKTNVLGTLFYDLLNGQDGGPGLLKDPDNIIKRFLLENFRDADGNDLSEDSIETYFSKTKVQKRAKMGDRIELGNVKIKAPKGE